MDRNYAINVIEDMFPVDSDYPKTAEIGEKLLKQAKLEVIGWRTEPTAVLIKYAQLCIDEDNRTKTVL